MKSCCQDMRHGDLGVKRSDIVYSIPCRAYYIYSKRIEEGFAGEVTSFVCDHVQ